MKKIDIEEFIAKAQEIDDHFYNKWLNNPKIYNIEKEMPAWEFDYVGNSYDPKEAVSASVTFIYDIYSRDLDTLISIRDSDYRLSRRSSIIFNNIITVNNKFVLRVRLIVKNL